MRLPAGVPARVAALAGISAAAAAPAAVLVLSDVRSPGLAWALVAVAPVSVVLLRYLPVPVAAPLAGVLVATAGAAAGWLAGLAAAVALLLTAASVAALAVQWRRDLAHLDLLVRTTQQRVVAVGVHDELTGCANHQGLMLLGEQVLHAVRRGSDSAHAVLVEVDGLDEVRRWSGSAARDLVLVAVAEAITAGTRATDIVARWGPDAFAVVGPGSGSGQAELERRIRLHLLDEPPVPPGLWPCRVTAGSGVLEPWDDGTLLQLLDRAEQDLSLRRALRSPSAPEPHRRERR